MAATRVFLLLCLSLMLIQSYGRENFLRVSSENHGRAEHPEWRVFWHQHPPLRSSWLPKTKWPFPHPPLPSWIPKTKFPHPPLPSWIPKTKFPHPPLPSWLPKTKFPHPPLPSWLPKTKFPHPPLPSWLPKTKWPFPHPPLPSWPWLPHGPHHSTQTLQDDDTKCHSTHAVVESCMKEGTYSFSDTNGFKFSTECCKSVAEIGDECNDELYVPLIKYQCLAHA